MEEKQMIYNDLLEWLKTLPIWMQKASDLILRIGKIEESDYCDIYDLFKAENGLSDGPDIDESVTFPELTKTSEDKSELYWKGVRNVHGVNALKSGESMDITLGLTSVYGENGSGKSGYTRLFNNAFISRGDKTLIHNIYESTHDEVYAEFVFWQDDKDVILKYPDDKAADIFKHIMVFDTESASRDMKSESELSFVPSEFIFFDKLLELCAEIDKRLQTEMLQCPQENPFNVFFDNPSSVKTLIENLSDKTNIADFEVLTLTDEEKKQLELITKEKAGLIALNISEKSNKLNIIKDEISKIADATKEINSYLAKDKLDILEHVLTDIKDAEDISKKEGLEQFEEDHIENLGSTEWKDFLIAAQRYYKSINTNINTCIFCGQNIEGIELIDKYWLYLESVAEKNLKVFNELLMEHIKKYKSLSVELPGEESLCGAWLLENCSEDYKQLKAEYDAAKKLRDDVLSSLECKSWESSISVKQINVQVIQKVFSIVENEINKLNADEIATRINNLTAQEIEYKDREKVVQLIPKIREYIEKLKWLALAEKKKIKTRSITSKQKELFTKYVTEDYIKVFEEECKKLNASFNAEIVQRGSKGTTLKKIAIKGEMPGSILSEGEQRAICIANFLAEVTTDPNNIGVIFDDPVSSLDHNRRHIIAERLVEESEKRQVVIFTHDITFFMELKTLCDKKGLEMGTQTIRKIVDQSGCISKVIPWQSMSVKDRIKRLNGDLQNLQKLEKEGDIDNYFYRAKEWCELLRESWERSVEEILLNDAIQRYNPCVQTQRLAKAPFTTDLYSEVEKGMTECSAWVHDRARAMNGGTPTTSELKEFIDTFNDFVKKNRP